jgi:hypothetical protein
VPSPKVAPNPIGAPYPVSNSWPKSYSTRAAGDEFFSNYTFYPPPYRHPGLVCGFLDSTSSWSRGEAIRNPNPGSLVGGGLRPSRIFCPLAVGHCLSTRQSVCDALRIPSKS